MQVYNFNVPTFGKGVVYDVDQKTRTEQFRFFTEALKKDRLAKYVPQFVAEAEVRSSAPKSSQGLRSGQLCKGSNQGVLCTTFAGRRAGMQGMPECCSHALCWPCCCHHLK
jgi:hypothetical protein